MRIRDNIGYSNFDGLDVFLHGAFCLDPDSPWETDWLARRGVKIDTELYITFTNSCTVLCLSAASLYLIPAGCSGRTGTASYVWNWWRGGLVRSRNENRLTVCVGLDDAERCVGAVVAALPDGDGAALPARAVRSALVPGVWYEWISEIKYATDTSTGHVRFYYRVKGAGQPGRRRSTPAQLGQDGSVQRELWRPASCRRVGLTISPRAATRTTSPEHELRDGSVRDQDDVRGGGVGVPVGG